MVLNGQSVDHIIGTKRMIPAIQSFIGAISRGERTEAELYEKVNLRLPGVAAFLLSKAMCHMIKKKFKEQGIDYRQESSYIQDSILIEK